jgi:hypothetical protein
MSTQFVSRFVLPFVLCLVGACGAGSYGPKAVCKPELNAQNLPTTKSLDCGDDACIKVDYNKSASETAMICAPIDALCATIAPTCAMAGKVCKLINGVPTCDFETPVDPCAGYTMCASGTVCKANTNGQPYCDRVSGFPEGASCKVDAECASMKCVSMKCVATCKVDAECATTEWCDSKTNTCQPDLQDGQTVCDRNAQCINGNCDVASGKCLPPVSGTCATDSQCSDALSVAVADRLPILKIRLAGVGLAVAPLGRGALGVDLARCHALHAHALHAGALGVDLAGRAFRETRNAVAVRLAVGVGLAHRARGTHGVPGAGIDRGLEIAGRHAVDQLADLAGHGAGGGDRGAQGIDGSADHGGLAGRLVVVHLDTGVIAAIKRLGRRQVLGVELGLTDGLGAIASGATSANEAQDERQNKTGNKLSTHGLPPRYGLFVSEEF